MNKDFAFITLVVRVPEVVAVARTGRELVELALEVVLEPGPVLALVGTQVLDLADLDRQGRRWLGRRGDEVGLHAFDGRTTGARPHPVFPGQTLRRRT